LYVEKAFAIIHYGVCRYPSQIAMKYKDRIRKEELKTNRYSKAIYIIWVALFSLIVIYSAVAYLISSQAYRQKKTELDIPEYNGNPYAEINGGIPFFDEDDFKGEPFEHYSDLDGIGRCGPAMAFLGRELMPTDNRGEIGSVRPTGWQQAKYEGLVDTNPPYLYNRCHLIAYCLTGENANEKNLITGTRYLNVNGMLPFEEMVQYYLYHSKNHVLYRVTPIFDGNNLLAKGVLMEACSVEDKGKSLSFCVFCYNVQPGVKINYKTGDSSREMQNLLK